VSSSGYSYIKVCRMFQATSVTALGPWTITMPVRLLVTAARPRKGGGGTPAPSSHMLDPAALAAVLTLGNLRKSAILLLDPHITWI
jgi:hypothetical protein